MVRSDDVDTLQLLVNAANNWQTTASGQNVVLTVITATINDKVVKLYWDATAGIWDITAE